jgi:hypothetical protein
MSEQNYTVGSTYDFTLTASKDGSPWELSLAAVQLLLRKPDGTFVSKDATLINGPAGTAHYVNLTTDLDLAGAWSRAWKITDGPVVQISEPISMKVVASP